MNTNRISIFCISFAIFGSMVLMSKAHSAEAITWLDASVIAGTTAIAANNPDLGIVDFNSSTPSTMWYEYNNPATVTSGGIDYTWNNIRYLNYDASSTGSSSHLNAFFEIRLPGLLGSNVKDIFVSFDGLGNGTQYVLNNTTEFLGNFYSGDHLSTITHTNTSTIVDSTSGLWNTTPDLVRVLSNNNFLRLDVDQVVGDGVGIAVGYSLKEEDPAQVPEPSIIVLLVIGFLSIAYIGNKNHETC